MQCIKVRTPALDLLSNYLSDLGLSFPDSSPSLQQTTMARRRVIRIGGLFHQKGGNLPNRRPQYPRRQSAQVLRAVGDLQILDLRALNEWHNGCSKQCELRKVTK